jgi:Predicted membrane protein (DUF2178)
MTVTQRVHVFNLVVIILVVGLFGIAAPMIGFSQAGGILGFMGFLGFGLLFYWRRSKGEVLADERDRTILTNAFHIGFAIFWMLFVLGCVGAWFFLGDKGAIPVRDLPTIMFLAWGIWQGAMSTAVLIQYRRAE